MASNRGGRTDWRLVPWPSPNRCCTRRSRLCRPSELNCYLLESSSTVALAVIAAVAGCVCTRQFLSLLGLDLSLLPFTWEKHLIGYEIVRLGLGSCSPIVCSEYVGSIWCLSTQLATASDLLITLEFPQLRFYRYPLFFRHFYSCQMKFLSFPLPNLLGSPPSPASWRYRLMTAWQACHWVLPLEPPLQT